ncbi:MAG: peptidoglycan bridge formation glycyltransferase FemA/FemB family protein [Patescibacteria group bacterium]
MKDIRQTPKYANYLEKIGWKVERTGNSHSFIKNISILGSVVKIQRPEEIDIDAFNFVRKKHSAFQTIIEPKSSEHGSFITEHGFKLSKSPYLPTKTLHLDLTKSVNELYNQLAKDAKYSLKKTRDLRIYTVTDTKGFRESWKQAVGMRRWVPPRMQLDTMLAAFKEDVALLVTPDGSSGAIFLQGDECAYYWQAFSSKKGRRSLAQYKIVWAGINWAKERGAKIFDFEGIYDKRFPNKKWRGFTHFKKSFGGFEVEYPGAFIKTVLPLKI